MKKYIEVIIKDQNNQKKIEKVTKGYAFNYLFPKGLAENATKGKIKHVKMLNNLSNKKRDLINQQKETIKNEIIKIQMIHLRKKTGKDYQIFGSLSELEIKETIFEMIGRKIEKKQITVKTIKQIGKYESLIFLDEGIKTYLNVRILPYHI